MLLLQIVYPDGTVAKFPAGGKYEVDLIILLTNEIMKTGHGTSNYRLIKKDDLAVSIGKAVNEFKRTTMNGFTRVG